MSRIKDLLGIARPGGIDDVVVRAVKSAVATFIGGITAGALPAFDIPTWKVAALAAASAAGSVVLNAVLLWAKSE